MKNIYFVMLIIFFKSSSAFDSVNTHPDSIGDSINTGRMILTYDTDDRHPLSNAASMIERNGWDKMAEDEVFIIPRPYNLKHESFSAYVPAEYHGSEPYGLIIWISAFKGGGPPDAYLPVLDKQKFIWIGGNNIGNERGIPERMALSLDALHNIKNVYNIDLHRIYVAGLSGGGRIASRLAIVYPELFSGGYYIIGCNYKDELLLDSEGHYITGFLPYYNEGLYIKGHANHYTLLTGSHDFNQLQTLKVWEAYREEGKKWAAYVEVPGMDHAYPDAHWFEIGLNALDRPLLIDQNLSQFNIPDESEAVQLWMKQMLELAEKEIKLSPLKTICILETLTKYGKSYPENKIAKSILKEQLSYKTIKKSYKIYKNIYKWHDSLMDKGYKKNWVKTLKKLENSIVSILKEDLSAGLRQELEELFKKI
ncbi:hypothetical protein KAR48_12945 [bacterium]|nr:hypothetical protein [bacterium]